MWTLYSEKKKRKNLDNISSCLSFKSACETSRDKLKKSLLEFKEKNKRIANMQLLPKSTTILNYCNIDNKIIDYICDTTEEK